VSVAAQLFGLILIASGVVAIFRRKARGSSEFEDERDYKGRSAIILGILWIVLGVAFVLYPSLMR
jgi:amino acid transporter